MDVSAANGSLAVGMLTKVLENESLKGEVIDKTLQAMEQMKQTQTQSMEMQKTMMNSLGIGQGIDTLV